jgi:hypothetical protein
MKNKYPSTEDIKDAINVKKSPGPDITSIIAELFKIKQYILDITSIK